MRLLSQLRPRIWQMYKSRHTCTLRAPCMHATLACIAKMCICRNVQRKSAQIYINNYTIELKYIHSPIHGTWKVHTYYTIYICCTKALITIMKLCIIRCIIPCWVRSLPWNAASPPPTPLPPNYYSYNLHASRVGWVFCICKFPHCKNHLAFQWFYCRNFIRPQCIFEPHRSFFGPEHAK